MWNSVPANRRADACAAAICKTYSAVCEVRLADAGEGGRPEEGLLQLTRLVHRASVVLHEAGVGEDVALRASEVFLERMVDVHLSEFTGVCVRVCMFVCLFVCA
jgi:hypothetical protein